MMRISICIYLPIIFCFIVPLNAQVVEKEEQPPWFFYWPTENPDNFNYSDMGNSTFTNSGDLQRRSNVDVNRELQENRQSADSDSANINVENIERNTENVSRPVSSSSLIKWVDDKGVTHVTNNINSVPEQYRSQVGLK